jgi:hypothetical protein
LFINCRLKQAVHAGKKGRSTRLRRFEAFPWARPQHAYAAPTVLHLLGSHLHPTRPIISDRLCDLCRFSPRLDQPSLSSRQPCFTFQTSREQRCMRERHSSTLPVCPSQHPTVLHRPDCCLLSPVSQRCEPPSTVPVTSHQPRPSHSNRRLYKLYKTATTIPQRLTVVISSRDDSLLVFSLPAPTLPFCTTCSYPLEVARREAYRVCMFAHVSPSCTTETPSREWQASFGLPTFPLPLCPPLTSPPVLYQNVPPMISGSGRDCQWSRQKRQTP